MNPHSTLYPLDIPRRCFHPKCIHGTTLGQVCYVGCIKRWDILSADQSANRKSRKNGKTGPLCPSLHMPSSPGLSYFTPLPYGLVCFTDGTRFNKISGSSTSGECVWIAISAENTEFPSRSGSLARKLQTARIWKRRRIRVIWYTDSTSITN